jgi:hypothetical protein
MDVTNLLVFCLKQRLGDSVLSPETRTSPIDWAQLNTYHLRKETESSLRNVLLQRRDRSMTNIQIYNCHNNKSPDRVCGLVVGVPGYRSRALCSIPGATRLSGTGPLSLVSTIDRLCGLVVRVPGYRSRGLGSISDPTSFSEK